MPQRDDKNETTRFLSDGVSFKAKLIGILEVSEARGDRMCQEALSDLKMAIRAAGEHKQRITINIALDGLRLRDEKTGDCLYHHPVHKISFIAQDMTDSRAFGYIFGSPDTGHRFFGIKTDKAASQVVIAMRDLFQVVFALKKKEIELAKQHLEKNYVLPSSPLFPSLSSTSKGSSQTSEKCRSEDKASSTNSELKSGTAVADLVDLELELSSLQQGLNQMERITPSDPFGSKDDPFGDSFVNYPINKPILPPPPSSGRERSSRTSESSSIFSPKTPHMGSADTIIDPLLTGKEKKNFSFSHDFGGLRDDSSCNEWFSPGVIFDETQVVLTETKKDEKHELAKQEIMSQFDVFTELDPLELKNPPKKALNDLVSTTSNSNTTNELNITFSQATTTQPSLNSSVVYTNTTSVFTSDPFGEDPFVKEDPFADSDFTRQDDPFESEFVNTGFPSQLSNLEKTHQKDSLQNILQSSVVKAPKSSTTTVQKPFEAHFDKFNEVKPNNMLSKMHNNPSLDISSESECAPEPPPRPLSSLIQIKPPPLPPKKQNEFNFKPPPRPPHTDDISHYEYIEQIESSVPIKDGFGLDRSPPLPVPQRKSKFEADFSTPPERPKKSFDLQSSEEDYLTPISFPESTGSPSVLLPPPQRSAKRQQETGDSKTDNLEGLDITLSQLTLSGLNELANKLNIPPSQLSNMTLVQLTSYLSNFIKDKSQKEDNYNFPTFHADFSANFNKFNNSTAVCDPTYDRYAVFRELQEEFKQTKIDTEPEEIQEEKEQLEHDISGNVNLDLKPLNIDDANQEDKYAALREIVEIELMQSELQSVENDENEKEDEDEEVEQKEEEIIATSNMTDLINEDQNNVVEVAIEDINLMNKDKSKGEENSEDIISNNQIIEYSTVDENVEKITTPIKSPLNRSPVKQLIVKSPIPNAVAEIIQNSTRLTSGSLSDVLSGSSPEIDNTGSNSDVAKRGDATAESWAIFDQATVPLESVKELPMTAQSEEGASPWSSDSKEFGTTSPGEWSRPDDERWPKGKRGRDDEWWDTSAEPEAPYYPSNRRSTDSYDEDYYHEEYDRPHRRRRQQPVSSRQQPVSGGHSSSSRDVSPWEEEQPRRRDGRCREWVGKMRGPSFDRHTRERRHTDSWDEDEFEYGDEQEGRFHWSERSDRHSSRESDRGSGGRDKECDRWTDDWNEEKRRRRRKDGKWDSARERWCCPDWELTDQHVIEKPSRYSTGRRGNIQRRDRQHDDLRDRYYSRDSQDSPGEDDISNDPEETCSPHYITNKRPPWKQRPNSASETDRRIIEMKSRHYLGTGGSDGERDRTRYKPTGRRSRSRDSQYSEPVNYSRHKVEPNRTSHMRPKTTHSTHAKTPEGDYGGGVSDLSVNKVSSWSESDNNSKKPSAARKKQIKEMSKIEEKSSSGTFPRKSSGRNKNAVFDNDFPTDSSPRENKMTFENDFGSLDSTSSLPRRGLKGLRQHSMFEKTHSHIDREVREKRVKDLKLSPRYHPKSKSLFEDDFSLSEKSENLPEDSSISSIKEEEDTFTKDEEESDAFVNKNIEKARRRILANRLSSVKGDNLKKSDSVNIFSRENDPFDDDFFSGNMEEESHSPGRNSELKWTDDFEKH